MKLSEILSVITQSDIDIVSANLGTTLTYLLSGEKLEDHNDDLLFIHKKDVKDIYSKQNYIVVVIDDSTELQRLIKNTIEYISSEVLKYKNNDIYTSTKLHVYLINTPDDYKVVNGEEEINTKAIKTFIIYKEDKNIDELFKDDDHFNNTIKEHWEELYRIEKFKCVKTSHFSGCNRLNSTSTSGFEEIDSIDYYLIISLNPELTEEEL